LLEPDIPRIGIPNSADVQGRSRPARSGKQVANVRFPGEPPEAAWIEIPGPDALIPL
jgi:hypothetical protein